MERLEGKFHGPMSISEDTSFHGMIAGNLDIGSGADVELRGMVAGSSMNRGRLKVYGVVRGHMRDQDGGETTLVNLSESRGDRERSRSGRRTRHRSAADL